MKELVLKSVDDAVAAGFAHGWVCSLWQVSDDRVHRWRARHRDHGTLVDRAPGGHPVHGILPAEIDAVLAVAEAWLSTAATASSPIAAPTRDSCGSRRRRSGVFWLLTGRSA